MKLRTKMKQRTHRGEHLASTSVAWVWHTVGGLFQKMATTLKSLGAKKVNYFSPNLFTASSRITRNTGASLKSSRIQDWTWRLHHARCLHVHISTCTLWSITGVSWHDSCHPVGCYILHVLAILCSSSPLSESHELCIVWLRFTKTDFFICIKMIL